MQRFRGLLHILDDLIARGHYVIIYKRMGKSGKKKKNSTFTNYDPADFYADCWNVDASTLGALNYLVHNFGLKVKHLDKIMWLDEQDVVNPDIVLSTDWMPMRVKRQVNIPHIGYACTRAGSKEEVGNGMCEAVRKIEDIAPVKGQVLVIHPGGGRTIVSPLREHIPVKDVLKNNVSLLDKLLRFLPMDVVSSVVIKTHPAPYIGCDKLSLLNVVIPLIKHQHRFPIKVVDDNLLGHIAKSEFIISLGSSTSLWLLASKKKWANVINCATYNLDSPKRRDTEERADSWFDWPQNVTFADLGELLSNYDSRLDSFLNGSPEHKLLYKKYRRIHEMPCNRNTIRFIEETGQCSDQPI